MTVLRTHAQGGSLAVRLCATLLDARFAWIAFWLVASIALSILSLLPGAAPPGAFGVDKALHLVAFAAIGFPPRFMTGARGPFLALIALSVALGVALECAQAVVPGRDSSLLDMAANAMGVALGAAMAAAVENALARHLEEQPEVLQIEPATPRLPARSSPLGRTAALGLQKTRDGGRIRGRGTL